MIRAGSLKRKNKGQTTCSNCYKNFNNAWIPKYCECGDLLGGTHETKTKQINEDAQLIERNLVSIRLHKQGTNVRTFVNLVENKVSYLVYISFLAPTLSELYLQS